MSTTEVFIEPEEADELVVDSLSSDLLSRFGDEGSEIGLAPYITFYVHHHDEKGYMALVEQLIEIRDTFEASIIDEPFVRVWRDETQDWLMQGDPKLPRDLRVDALRSREEVQRFIVGATDMTSTGQTARWSYKADVTPWVGDSHATLKLTFRLKWYRQNRVRWHTFVKDCLRRLTPDHCYSGFEVGNGDFNIVGSYEADVLERVLADRLYGVDIDHPGPMRGHSFGPNHLGQATILGAGIRTPTWSFMLSPYWQSKLGKTEPEIRAELDDPRIEITAIDYPKNEWNPEGRPGLWIRLGELDLYPVERGVPDLLVKANRLIRPVRCDYLELLTLAPWDDDPNPRFDYLSSIRWMRRFDADSDWPSAEVRAKSAPAPERSRLRGMPGERVPRSGLWWTPAMKGEQGRRRFEAGQNFPDTVQTEWGAVIWYLE